MMEYYINPDGTRTRIREAMYYITGLNPHMRKNLDLCRKAVELGHPIILLVDGGLHTGKTNSAITMARYFQPDFDFNKQVGRGIDQFAEAWNHTINMKTDFEAKICVFDEAQTFNRRGAMTKLNRAMDEFFSTHRHNKVMLIFCLPHFRVLDKSIYDTDAVIGLIHMEFIKKQYADYRQYDAYQIAYMNDILENENKAKNRNRKLIYNRAGFVPWGHIRLPEDFKQIAKSSNIGKNIIQSKTLKAMTTNSSQ